MPKYIILIILFFSYNTQAARRFELRPLCFSSVRNCNGAINALNIPPRGKFRIYPTCRPKTQMEIQNRVCHQWVGVLAIPASVALGPGQWIDRNQCYEHMKACEKAADIWNQLSHNNLSIKARCTRYNRRWWRWNDKKLRQNGIYRCGGSLNTELRIRIKRIR